MENTFTKFQRKRIDRRLSRVERQSGCSNNEKTENVAKVTLKKSVDLKGAVMVIVGCQVGSGIFVSPKGVLEYTNSPGLCLIVWALGGLLAGLGSMVYAELACVIPKSGGEFAFMYHGLPRGKFPAYLFAFTGATILKTATLGIIAITFGDYAMKFMSPSFCQYSDNYETAQKLWAILAIATGAALNIVSIEWTQKSVKFFGLGKFISLVAIIIGGVYFAVSGKADLSIWYPENLFSPIFSEKSVLTGLGFAFYQAMWSYDGWNQLTYIIEEMKRLSDLPKALMISIVSVISFYVCVNISYLTVLGPIGLLESEAVGAAFANKIYPGLDRAISFMVMLSTFGAIVIASFTAARGPFVAAREGMFPKILAMINVDKKSPSPSVLFSAAITIFLIVIGNFTLLINIFSFTMWFFHTLTFVTCLVLRFTKPEAPRPVRVPFPLILLTIFVGTYLTFTPFLQLDYNAGISSFVPYFVLIGWMSLGLAMYLFVKRFNISDVKFTRNVQKILNVVYSEE